MMRRRPTADERKQTIEHLAYEIWMLVRTRQLILERWEQLDRVVANAVIEAHAVHVRNLICFLFDRSDGKEIRASDFVPEWQEVRTETLGRAQGRVDTEIAHISYERLKVSGPAKAWDPSLDDEILAALDRWIHKAGDDVKTIVVGDFLLGGV